MENKTFKVVGDNVILESLNGAVTNHYTVDACAYHSNDLAQFNFDNWVNDEVQGRFESGCGIRSSTVYCIGGNVEEKAFTEKWLMRKNKQWLCDLNNLLANNAYYCIDDMLKEDFVDNLLSVTKLELLEKSYNEGDFSFVPFYYEVVKVAGYCQGDVFIIINLDKTYKVDYDSMQNLAFSSPIDGSITIWNSDNKMVYELFGCDFDTDQYDWVKERFILDLNKSLKLNKFEQGLIDCIKQIIDMKLSDSLDYI